MKILHTADWHIGSFKGPEKDGINLRSLDTKKCLDAMIEKAAEEIPELALVSGDIFHTGKTWSDRCCDEVVTAIKTITKLSEYSKHVVVMRGTPNHDGDGQFKVLQTHFSDFNNVHIVINPEVIKTEHADIAVLPGFNRGEYRAKFPGFSKEEENEVFTQELSNIVMGLKAQCDTGKSAILMAHYTVPGCNTESGQTQLLTQFEPVIPQESLQAANFDLVALGHIHRPQLVAGMENVYYSGAINACNFNDEGQERGFWIHEIEPDLPYGNIDSRFIKTPNREFITFHFTDTDITAITQGNMDEVAMNWWRWNGAVAGKIVRILYECSAEKHKALNTAPIEKTLYEDGAFYVSGITPERVDPSADRTDLSQQTDPEENLRMYLEEKQLEPEVIGRLIEKARPIIAEAMASDTTAAFSGMFIPIEIEVKNYRAYAEERFSFEDIHFCTINGSNGAGKSSLFMDAIIDCIFEEPREGKSTSVKVPWLRNAEGVRSGYIAFTFTIGDNIYRITRTRAKSGPITLSLAEFVDGEWQDRSKERANDTQAEIEKLIGVDSITFKSCALIMQDQYGLFLQAKKEDRMVVLGNLLGLGIYEEMGWIAKDKSAEFKRIIDRKKQSIKVQADNILSAGKPKEELEEAEARQQELDQQLNTKNLEKETSTILLNSKKAAKERYVKLTDSITILERKKWTAEENRGLQNNIMADCDGMLAEEPEITVQVGRYRELLEKEKQLIEGSTLYNTKVAETNAIQVEIIAATGEIKGYRLELDSLNKQLDNSGSQADRDEITKKADEYKQKKEQLDKMYALAQEFSRLSELVDRKAYALSNKKAILNEKERMLNGEQAALERKASLLADSGCIDLDNAKCRFLADAVESKNLLKNYSAKFATLEKKRNTELMALEKELKEAETERDKLGYSKEDMEKLRQECNNLKPFEGKLKALQEHESNIILIKASITNMQLNLSKAEEMLGMLKIRAQETEDERLKYQYCHIEHEHVVQEIEDLKFWVEKEKQLPVAKERKGNSEKRLLELSEEIVNLENDIRENQERAQAEMESAEGVESLEEQVRFIQADIDQLTKKSKENQIAIGSLKQKIEEVRRMKKAIDALQAEITDRSENAADYDTLKLSFSQDGIPHQIIRTVIPKLSATANNILGQMTGGQLGVDFATEKVLKNGKKEVVTLDIFIEEYGKSSLPYLSKSGGEKVKASLSVILALAEMKASTAGIQFGMLFIDEPPFLDADGIQAYCDALETIRERYPNIRIMAITHDPTMKSRFPQSLDVVKTEQGSKVLMG